MSGPANLDWLYLAAGWTLAALGAALLLWALFWDRSRGSRRCPKCWYDMAGVPGLRCPECGREAGSEKSLFKTRRRRWPAVAGLAIGVIGCAIAHIPTVSRRGMIGAVPSVLLVGWMELTGWPRPYSGGSLDWAGELEIRKRDSLGWLDSHVADRMARYWTFDYRPRWPAGVSIAVRPVQTSWYNDGKVNCVLQARLVNGVHGTGDWVSLEAESGRTNSNDWGDGFRALGLLAEGAAGMTLDLRVVHYTTSGTLDEAQPAAWTGQVTWPIQIVSSIDDLMKPVRDVAIDAEIKQGFVMKERSPFGLHHPNDRVTGFGFALDGTAKNAHVTTAMKVEFLGGKDLLGSSRIWNSDFWIGSLDADNTGVWMSELPLNGNWRQIHALKQGEGEWSVRISADPELALRDLTSTRYWSGEIVLRGNEIRALPPDR